MARTEDFASGMSADSLKELYSNPNFHGVGGNIGDTPENVARAQASTTAETPAPTPTPIPPYGVTVDQANAAHEADQSRPVDTATVVANMLDPQNLADAAVKGTVNSLTNLSKATASGLGFSVKNPYEQAGGGYSVGSELMDVAAVVPFSKVAGVVGGVGKGIKTLKKAEEEVKGASDVVQAEKLIKDSTKTVDSGKAIAKSADNSLFTPKEAKLNQTEYGIQPSVEIPKILTGRRLSQSVGKAGATAMLGLYSVVPLAGHVAEAGVGTSIGKTVGRTTPEFFSEGFAKAETSGKTAGAVKSTVTRADHTKASVPDAARSKIDANIQIPDEVLNLTEATIREQQRQQQQQVQSDEPVDDGTPKDKTGKPKRPKKKKQINPWDMSVSGQEAQVQRGW